MDLSVINAGELVTCSGKGEGGLGVVEDGAMLVRDGRVTWVGTSREFKRKFGDKKGRVVDAQGGLVHPGFVDPHTHLLFAGSREDELERKISGESYTKILESGGGIARTIRETRRASVGRLVKESGARVSQLVANGVTTIEVKTGYGQRFDDEVRMLAAIERFRRTAGAELVPTFLGLHARPPEFQTSKEYVRYAVNVMLPRIASMNSRPSFSDAFCEEGVFSREECAKYLRASARLGFKLKIHADEFSDSGGAALAAELGCVSADHLGRSNRAGVRAMARKGVVAVLLPGTSFYSGIPFADARGMINAGCTVALGTDLSPNSWVESPQMVMSLACNAMKMTPAEALLAFTRNAARALGRRDIGTLEQGAKADFVVSTLPGYRFLAYRVGGQYVRKVYKGGKEIFASAG